RQPHLERRAKTAVVVHGLAIAVVRQQPGIDPPPAAVEFDAQLAEQIDAETYRALGVAGVHFENEALRPFFGFGLLAGTDDIGEVTAEIIIACLQGRRGVLDETTLGSEGRRHRQGGSDSQGQRRDVQHSGHVLSRCCCFLGTGQRFPGTAAESGGNFGCSFRFFFRFSSARRLFAFGSDWRVSRTLGLGFFSPSRKWAAIPKISPQKAADSPSSDIPEAVTRKVIRAASRSFGTAIAELNAPPIAP